MPPDDYINLPVLLNDTKPLTQFLIPENYLEINNTCAHVSCYSNSKVTCTKIGLNVI